MNQLAEYRHKVMRWDNSGNSYYEYIRSNVMVLDETDKSYKIQFIIGESGIGRITWVGRRKVYFNYLNDDYCALRQRYIPASGCSICNMRCALSKQKFPK